MRSILGRGSFDQAKRNENHGFIFLKEKAPRQQVLRRNIFLLQCISIFLSLEIKFIFE